MLYLRFSLIFLLLTKNSYGLEQRECLLKEFSSSMERFIDPMGIFKLKLSLDKKNCEITVGLEKYKVMKKRWIIDVCRTPVHIKKGVKMVEVLKRENNCLIQEDSEYCESAKELMTLIQDEGLIFAEGQKENLSSNHGKFYCSYQLFNKYLYDGIVFDHDIKVDKRPPTKVQKTVVEESTVDKQEEVKPSFPGNLESSHEF